MSFFTPGTVFFSPRIGLKKGGMAEMGESMEMQGGGQLFLERQGGLVRLEASREDDGRGLYKVWLRGDRGRQLLGTLAPEGGMLRLCRRVSCSSLAQQGCWPVRGAECVLAFSFSQGWIRCLCPPIADDIVRPMLEGRQVLICRGEEGFSLALPTRPDRPFPLTPLFCLGRVEQVNGQQCVVYRFDGRGRPCSGEKHGGEHC